MSNPIDQARLEGLQAKLLDNVGGAMGVLMAYLGDQAGVYRALEQHGPCSHSTLANHTGLEPRYLREWLSANAAFEYIDYNPETDEFQLSPEQAAIFADEGGLACMQGFFQSIVSQYATHDTALDVFRSGRGRPWGEHHECCFCGVDRFFRPSYAANLVSSWIPSLDGIETRLKAGAHIADIGCGQGTTSLLLAEHYPNSTVLGADFFEPSITTARQRAQEAGLGNIEFEVSPAKQFSGKDYDLICIFDALHDMGDPVGAARHMLQALKTDGKLMVVEPLAGDSLKENLNTLSGLYYSFSTMVCIPASRAQEVGLGLGAQAGEARLTGILKEAGFSTVRKVMDTATNMILEATP
ncbi:class I SAM-dependent methyltransferase [Endozoicomonadaceae bacterium StTr2]